MSGLRKSLRLLAMSIFIAVSWLVTPATGPFLASKWTTENGLPQSTVTAILQSREGYIWLGTFGGLARFDGIRFTVFDSANSPGFEANRITSLAEDQNGRLWIGTETGHVYRFSDGKFELQNSAIESRGPVQSILEDSDGTVYLAGPNGLEMIRPSTIDPPEAEVISRKDSYGLIKAPDGTVFVREDGVIKKLQNGQLLSPIPLPPNAPSENLRFILAADGRMLLSGDDSIGIVESGKYKELIAVDPKQSRQGFSIGVEGDRFWFQQSSILRQFGANGAESFDLRGYVENGSRLILFDNEGNLWLATQTDGLVRLTRRRISLLSEMIGTVMTDNFSMLEDRQGAVWIAGASLLRVKDGKATPIDQVEGPYKVDVKRSVAMDGDGRIWTGGADGLGYVNDRDILVTIPEFEKEHVHALFFDHDRNLWVGHRNGLTIVRDGKISKVYRKADGLASDSVHYITQMADGTIWIGTSLGISRFRNGAFENLTAADGLSGNFVRDIIADNDGSVWVATYGGGISRFKDGKFARITKTNGLPNNFVSRILIGPNGSFWILTNFGIFVADRDKLNAVADGTTSTVIGAVYGVMDGMPSSEASGGHQPAGMIARDGRFWFPMIRDIVIIDPDLKNERPPKVIIESVVRPGGFESLEFVRSADGARSVNVPSNSRSIEIQYTGLSFTKPEGVRFFYRLDGLDPDWIDAGSRRTAFYPYLPAGTYRFLVRAVNADGVMSEQPATIIIDVGQEFWETRWFLGGIVLLAFVIVILVYRNRLRRVNERQRQQRLFSKRLIDAHESERVRMAKEIHDGLGQNLLLIKNWSLLGRDVSDSNVEVSEYLDRISSIASDSIEEARSIAHNLGPQNLRRFGVSAAIDGMLDRVQDSSGVLFERKIENIDGLFAEESEISIYRIVQECVSNVVRHSESPRCEVEILKDEDVVTIRIRDFGKGFDDVAESGDATSEGFGLQSIAQRVNFLGGRYTLISEPGNGTTVTIKLGIEKNESNPENSDR